MKVILIKEMEFLTRREALMNHYRTIVRSQTDRIKVDNESSYKLETISFGFECMSRGSKI
jgi:hypothetical protein